MQLKLSVPSEVPMRCAKCGASLDPADSFCRRCGEALGRQNLSMVVSRSLLPVPWSVVRGPVLRGVAALVVGTVVELARREAARRSALPSVAEALALLPQGIPLGATKRPRFPWSRAPRGEYEVTETVIQRRVLFKR